MAKRKTKTTKATEGARTERRQRMRQFMMGDARALVDARAVKRKEPPARKRAQPPDAPAPAKRRNGKRNRARKDA